MMALAGGPAAFAAAKRLPIKAGPHGMSRAPSVVTPKIVGGTSVPDGKYRFQAALLAQSFGNDDFQRQYCGGSLITPFEVLTAAHCVEFIGDAPGQIPLSDLRVVVGRTVLTSTQGQKRRAVAIDIHPRWDPVTFSFDVAVIHLASAVNGIKPVMLVTPGVDALERPGTLATVTGWGNTIQQPVGPGGGGIHYPDRMREAQVPIVSRAECQTVYTNAGDPIDATMLCAGRTNLDTCQGDSGGPLFFNAAGGGFIQAGITSWGNGCGATGFPGVYTRLSNRGVGNFVLSVTGGVPVNAAQAA
jgi:secreted trypsin-like serine protease